ncbi:TPA: hypothetical protein DDW69_03365 [candidate division CPR2 bacterium]|uniref:DUF218 domain-containing protein n=1 Tax=candidate division CPR2 bacterium GW2011_GWC1_41_48 TaxID=1618344 RepID=A0A0G0YHN0_UNCC2|nr:MAG: hypothetical protein UT47_C0003G0132 [candidate division CPR2 bacterium GW2011_GWC2_39_35]KKR28354.1 MAG: hypothetical protein UT60_C0022G0010 [candidate division CPR2 bacterium GW2011_GWD2_39_7]KKR28381.1 MAG: hypothetical protein UT59_C0029G0005 [candidate division CPR2 bacterium GW2011_GWD1_39_7]KKS09071.1 MAG: hypothetical protein UU65_C0003G0126 [candidate division CPR2 bacterium GW2011_GWC1_41_48]HBG81856.1 hypothetical protein [candidate division CPR2 bacterium]
MKSLKWFFMIIAIFIVPITLIGMFFSLGFWLSPQDDLLKSDAIIVISGGETEARTKEGIKLLNENLGGYIIFSGAAEDKGISNAAAMKKIALEQNVPKDKILMEEESKTTYENAKNVKEILEEKSIKKIILVTSPYHQKRAYLTFRSVLGDSYQILNHSAIDSTWRRSKWWQNPGSVELTLREGYRLLYIKLSGSYE